MSGSGRDKDDMVDALLSPREELFVRKGNGQLVSFEQFEQGLRRVACVGSAIRWD